MEPRVSALDLTKMGSIDCVAWEDHLKEDTRK